MWANPCRQLLRKVNGLAATDIVIPAGIFNFIGQAKVDTFAIDLDSLPVEQRAYDAVMVNKYRLSLEAIRLHANEFSYWQRRRSTGRPPVPVDEPTKPTTREELDQEAALIERLAKGDISEETFNCAMRGLDRRYGMEVLR